MQQKNQKRFKGKVTRQELLETRKEVLGGRELTINVYSIKFDTEKDVLWSKRDINAPQDLIGKTLSYQKTKEGLIFNSKVIK